MDNNEQQFENFVRGINFDDTPDAGHRDLLEKDLLAALTKRTRQKQQPLQIWRFIMKNRMTKLATAAVIIVAVALSVTILDRTSTPAWALEQTINALGNTKTLVINVVANSDDGSESMPFKFWFRLSEDNKGLFDMRFECEEEIHVIRGKKAWSYWHDHNLVKIYDDVTTSDSAMRDLRFWYKLAELHPWIRGKGLQALKWFADDWKETYGQDERTGRDCVFVTCSYESLSISLWFVFDLESKLIVEAKYWRNTNLQGPPKFHATSFAYNEEISDEVFDFQIPEGAKVIYRAKVKKQQKEAEALLEQGEELFHKEKKYAEALEVYKQVYDKFPKLNNGVDAAHALMMIGVCHGWLGQPEKAIEAFQKAISEYPHLKGWIDVTYFYLGCVYTDQGQKAKALEAFKNCLKLGEGVRDPDKFPLKHAREGIEKLTNQE
jgi:tetratricopeptide (TPR) repeat protein